MAETLFTGPVPAEGLWCAICAGIAKQAVLVAHKDEIESASKADGPAAWFQVPDSLGKASEAVTIAVSLFPQLGSVPLCWSHVVGVDTDPSHARRPILPAYDGPAFGAGLGVPPGPLRGLHG